MRLLLTPRGRRRRLFGAVKDRISRELILLFGVCHMSVSKFSLLNMYFTDLHPDPLQASDRPSQEKHVPPSGFPSTGEQKRRTWDDQVGCTGT